jgi:GxxExxY protein
MNQLSGDIIGAAIEVHRELGGPGLLEDIYEEAFAYELELRGFTAARQILVPVFYKNYQIKKPLVIDLLVNEKIIVEVKATEKYNKIFEAQLLTYLHLTKLNLGLVINFGVKYL